jgi:serine/threonine protein kinase
MSYDLRCFGWESCVIPHSLQGITNLVPTWTDLKILRHLQNTPHSRVKPDDLRLLNQFFYDADGKPYMPGYTKGEQIGDGSYARIYLGKRGIFHPIQDKTDGIVNLSRNVHMNDICIKDVPLRVTRQEQHGSPRTRQHAYDEELRSILHEAFLHALVLKVFQYEGLPQQVPVLHEVVGLTKKGHTAHGPDAFESVWLLMERLRGVTLETYLKRTWIPHDYNNNETVLIDILIQLAYSLHILQKRLRFNHRDMKLNNLFIRSQDASNQMLSVPNYGIHRCQRILTLLDFGFSCIGCKYDGHPLVSAGTWFHEEDTCFKPGRDICTFLYALHAAYPLDDYISPALYTALRTAMVAICNDTSIDLLCGLDKDGHPLTHSTQPIQFHEGLYKCLSQPNLQIPGCEPLTLLSVLRVYTQGFPPEP